MRVFIGEAGKWLTFEWLPAYFLVGIIVPLSFLWPVPPASMWDAAVHVLSAGDLLAVNVCLLATSTVSSIERLRSGYSSGRQPDFSIPFQLVFLGLASCVAYAVMKTVPVDQLQRPDLAVAYTALTILMSFWTVSIIVLRKAAE